MAIWEGGKSSASKKASKGYTISTWAGNASVHCAKYVLNTKRDCQSRDERWNLATRQLVKPDVVEYCIYFDSQKDQRHPGFLLMVNQGAVSLLVEHRRRPRPKVKWTTHDKSAFYLLAPNILVAKIKPGKVKTMRRAIQTATNSTTYETFNAKIGECSSCLSK